MASVQGSRVTGTEIAFPAEQLVGFGPRVGATLIDSVPLFIIGLILAAANVPAIGYLVDAAYFIFFWSTSGITLGNRLLKIQVVKQDGSALSFGTGIVRYIGYFLSSLALGIGFLWVLWDPNKQGWHDKMAHTVVIRS